jgi:hypothetical protein
MDFIDYCYANSILLAVFPPHSTHTLQPLDVICFKPLSSNYSSIVTNHLYKTQGLLAVQKEIFFPLFWSAWQSSFTTDLARKSFKATGIWPIDPSVILQRFCNKGDGESEARSSTLLEADWREMERLVRASVRDTTVEDSKSLSQTLHQLTVQNEMLKHENSGLREALIAKKKRKNANKALNLQRKESYHGGATFWLPCKMREARARDLKKQQQEEAEMAAKATRKELQVAAKALQEQEKEERRVERVRLREERERERAAKLAARKARIAAQNTKKPIQNASATKRKVSQKAPSKSKRSQRSGGGTACVASPEAAPAAPPKVSSCGRAITLSQKLR